MERTRASATLREINPTARFRGVASHGLTCIDWRFFLGRLLESRFAEVFRPHALPQVLEINDLPLGNVEATGRHSWPEGL